MRIRILLCGLLALVLIVVVAGAAAVLRLRASGRPVRDGEHRIPGLRAPVTVRWDRWGVPSVAAESEEDLAAAVGYLHANDRMTQLELGRRAGFGRLAELLGEAAVEFDVHFRTLRIGPAAEALWDHASPRSRRWLEAYAAGVNAWLAERGGDLPPGLRLLGAEPEPWTPAHSLAFAILMTRDLSFWRDRPEEERFGWLRAFGAEGVRDLMGDPELHVPEEILKLARETAPAGPASPGGGDRPAPGSNNWAVGPSRTASGRALVANDPHLKLFLPGTWYQMHLRAPGYEVAGMTLPGIPAVVIGRGPHLAWAFTHTMLDDHDLFFEILDETGRNYRRGETWKPLEIEQATIRIRGGGTHVAELRSTDRGPLLAADPERGLPPRSLAWMAYAACDPAGALRDMTQARTVDEVLAAIEGYYFPAQNLVVALDGGELLFTVLGRVPQRLRGDGRLPSPGWDPTYGWDGVRDRETNPTVVAPADDLLATANHDVRPPGYSLPLSADFEPPQRAARIREVLMERDDWDWEGFAALQTDLVSVFARDVVAALADDYDGDARRAYEVLTGWDKAMERHGPAALFALAEQALYEQIFGDEATAAGLPPFGERDRLVRILRGEMDPIWWDDVRTAAAEGRREILSRALAAAWHEVRERWGEDPAGWSYGTIHQLTLRHRLDAVPGFGAWTRRGPWELPGSRSTVGLFGGPWREDRADVTYGPSMRWVVDWSQPERVFTVMPGGQSGHPADPHYDDQLAAYFAGRLHPSPYSEKEIADATVAEMILIP